MLGYATPELMEQLRAGNLPTEDPTPDSALDQGRFKFKRSSEINVEMEAAILRGDARQSARLGQELERAKHREFLAGREREAQAKLWS